MLYNEAWFIHAVNGAVEQASQEADNKVFDAVQVKTGVVGKTWPFNVLDMLDMAPMTARDGNTVYANPNQTKRRAVLNDFGLAVLIDDFDEIRTLTNPQSEVTQALVMARNRKLNELLLGPFTSTVGGAMGAATVVNEKGETTSTSVLPTSTTYYRGQAVYSGGQTIANGSAGLTVAKVRTASYILNAQDVPMEGRTMFYSPRGGEQLLRDPQVTSRDFNTVQALAAGGLPPDMMWMGFRWRMTTSLPVTTGNIRACCAIGRRGVGIAVGKVTGVETGRDPSKWNNPFALIKLSAGAVRIMDPMVVQVDIDESV